MAKPSDEAVNPTLRQAWTELITAADLDDHMREVGQGEANALLLQAMLAKRLP